MGSVSCTECGAQFTFDVMPRRGAVCFKCHVRSIRLGFTETKEVFHGPTHAERRAEIEHDAAVNGITIERLPAKAWV